MLHNRLFIRADASELLLRAATIGAQSWNAEARTFEAVFSTGSPVERQEHKGAYTERLSLDQDWSPFVGAPVVDSHRRGSVGDIFGSVVSAQTVGNEARATIRMSKRRKAEGIVQDILAGHIRGVSVGYRVDSWKDSTEAGKRIRTAMKWTAVELSLVAVGADPAATIRSQNMETQTTPPPIIDRAQVNVEIRSIARVAGLPQTWTDSQIDQGVTVEQAQANAFLAMQARSDATANIRTATAGISGHDATDPEFRARTIGEAVFSRMSGTVPSEAARPYAGLTMVELAKDCLRAGGLSITGSPATIMERALLTTSDLPAIMADSVNRTMRMAYEAASSGLKRVAHQTTARDFRMKHRIQLSAAPILQPVNEDGEFRAGAISDQQETYRLSTFGRIIGFTRQAFVIWALSMM